ncbi:MAG: phosphatase PAP2 family protein [Halobacteriales archaeon]|nr:phosphatase PAP2 family protein [Halobacteriales archaeon]
MRRAQRWMLAGLVAGLGGFGLVALDDLARGPIYHADTAVFQAVSDWDTHGGDPHAVGDALTMIGDGRTVAVAVVFAAAFMLVRREWVLAAWCIGLAIAATLAVDGLKFLFHRARPPLLDATRLSYSFPSGHTIGATAGLGAAIILATEALVRTRRAGRKGTLHIWTAALCAWGALALLTGTGRVLEQEHWLSDVMASWGLGLALVCGLLFALSRRARGGDPGPTVPEKPGKA